MRRSKRNLLLGPLLAALFWPTAVFAEVDLTPIGSAADRPHLVRPGRPTTFVFELRNTSLSSQSVSVAIEVAPADRGSWSGALVRADDLFQPLGDRSAGHAITLAARESAYLLAELTPAGTVPERERGEATVSLVLAGESPQTLMVRAEVRDRPKIYFVALDACGAGYLEIDRIGRWDGDGHDPLMPRTLAFLEQAALFSEAEAHLPSSTDGNHAAAITGSWPGTLGIFSVKTHFLGLDESGAPVVTTGHKELMRWGADGATVRSIFDVAKDPSSGGDPDLFSVLISGKRWLGELVRDDEGSLDIIASGYEHPAYVPAPEPYRLGDPPSDPDAATDREGTNLGPRQIKKMFSAPAIYAGNQPKKTPEDRWVAEAVIRMIAVEDPDLLYANLSQCDTVQHIFGSTDNPDEWQDRGTPYNLWDDVNVYNRRANRDPVLDTVFEADQSFGLILDALLERGSLEPSYVIVLSDHGVTNVMRTEESLLEIGSILQAHGVDPAAVERLVASGGFGWVALADPAAGPTIESILESYELQHPVLGVPVKPFIVVDRNEMDTGIDGVEGVLGGDGILGNARGFLYSESSIDYPAGDHSKVRWPDLFIFNRHHYQNSLVRSDGLGPGLGSIFQGHHGSLLSSPMILGLRGPGIRPGTYLTEASPADIVPTLYRLLGLKLPEHADGRVLEEILIP